MKKTRISNSLQVNSRIDVRALASAMKDLEKKGVLIYNLSNIIQSVLQLYYYEIDSHDRITDYDEALEMLKRFSSQKAQNLQKMSEINKIAKTKTEEQKRLSALANKIAGGIEHDFD